MIGNIWLLFLVVILSFAILIPLACCKSVARQVPINYYLLAGFTFCEGYLVGFICIEYEPMTVLQAAIMTTALVFTLTAYAFTTKTDFTVYTGIMLCFLVCLLLFGIFLMFFHSELLRTIYLALGVLCFGIYLIIDTQMIMGGHHHQIELDDYIMGALTLYLDIINLFIKILELLAKAKGE